MEKKTPATITKNTASYEVACQIKSVIIKYMNELISGVKIIQRTVNKKISDYKKNKPSNFYKEKYTLEERLWQSQKIMEKYPSRLPIICDVSQQLPDLDKHKYLIPEDLKSETFMFIIRKRMKLDPATALYFFVNEKVLYSSSPMFEIYEKYKDEDGFLYIHACAESTFG